MPAPVKKPVVQSLALPRGRPCLLTPECERILMREIENGLPLKEAAELAGISYDTLNRWRQRGEIENAPPEFRDFCKALRRAKAAAMQKLVSRINEAGKSDWRASAWMLERRHPDEFGNPNRGEVKGHQANQMPTHPVALEILRRKEERGRMEECLRRFAAAFTQAKAMHDEEQLQKQEALAVSKPGVRLRGE